MKPSRSKEERDADQIDRGLAAQRLIEDKVVIAFLEAERKRLVDEMIAAKITDDDARRAAALELQALSKLKSHLASTAAMGRKLQEKAKDNE